MSASRTVRRTLALVAGTLALLYACGYLYLWLAGDRAVFLPNPPTYSEADCRFLNTKSGKRIAFRVYERPAARYTLLYSHGSAGDLGMLVRQAEALQRFGFNVVVYDYPGVGLSTGPLSEKGCYEAIELVYEWILSELKTPPDRIILYGRSIGTGPSLYLAEKKPAAGLILVSPFTSALGVHWSTAIFGFEKFPNYKWIGNVPMPMLIVHGKQDENIPWSEAVKLKEMAREHAVLLLVEESGHKDLDRNGEFWKGISMFIKEKVDR